MATPAQQVRRGLESRKFSIAPPGGAERLVNLDPDEGVVHKATPAEFKGFGKWLDLYSENAATAATVGTPLKQDRWKCIKGRLLGGQVKGCLEQLGVWMTANQPTVTWKPETGRFDKMVQSLSAGIALMVDGTLRAKVVSKVRGEHDATTHGVDGMMFPTTTAAECTAKAAMLKKTIDGGMSKITVRAIAARLLRLEKQELFKVALLTQ